MPALLLPLCPLNLGLCSSRETRHMHHPETASRERPTSVARQLGQVYFPSLGSQTGIASLSPSLEVALVLVVVGVTWL